MTIQNTWTFTSRDVNDHQKQIANCLNYNVDELKNMNDDSFLMNDRRLDANDWAFYMNDKASYMNDG